MRLYSYIVATDDGFAPCAQGSVCSLAICKPVVRRVAQWGNWVMGTTPKERVAGRLVYLMEVAQARTFAEYYNHTPFRRRRDNIYRPRRDGTYVQLPNGAHDESNMPKDLSVDRVLLSGRFVYFGNNAPAIPPEFRQFIAKGEGHRVFGNRHGEARDEERDEQIAALVKWAFSQGLGICGEPSDPAGCDNGCD